MANIDDMVIKLRLETNQMKSELANVKTQMSGLGTGVQNAVTPVKTLTGAFGGLVKSMLPLLAAGAVIGFLKESAKAAADDATSQELLARQLRNTVGATKAQVASVEEQISALEKVSGVADDEIRPSFTKLLLATKDTSKAMEMQKLAMDVSAATGKSLTAVTMAFSRAAAGNDTALNRLVPSLKNVTDKTGFLHKNFDGAAKAVADTNPYKRMAVAIDNIKESVGRGLLPIVKVLSDVMVKIAPIFDMLGQVIEKIMDPVMKLVGVILDMLMPPLEHIMNVIMGVIDEAIAPLEEALNSATPLLKDMGEWWKFLGDVLGGYIKMSMTYTIGLWKLLFAILKPVMEALHNLWTALQPLIRQLKIVGNIVGQVATQLWEKLMKSFKSIWQFIQENFIPIWKNLVKAMKPFVDFVVNGLVGAFKQLMKILGPLWENVLKPIVDTIMKALGIKIDMKAAVKVDDSEVDKAVAKVGKTKVTKDLFSGGFGGTGGTGAGSGQDKKDKTQNVTNINTNVLAKTDANPKDIAANIVNAIKFNLPVSIAGAGTGVLARGAGSQVAFSGSGVVGAGA